MEEFVLYKLLLLCTTRVSVPGKKGYGTGFFIAPGLILTCAHVVADAHQTKQEVEIYWNARSYTAQFTTFLPDLDLAMLQVDLTNHPCVFLHAGAEPYSKLYTYGYPDNNPNGEPATFDCEGWTGDQPAQLKFKLGQVRPGMSGSPLLNWQTGGVCGLVQLTRDRSSDLGGKAILTETVMKAFPTLADLQRRFHEQDKRWAKCLTSQQRQQLQLGQLPSNPAEAVKVFVSYVRADEALRNELAKHLKPMDISREGLINVWYADNIEAGEDTRQEAKVHLDTARIILLLVSPDFLDSDYHYDVEMAQALERHKAGEARVIPIILRYTEGWEKTEFNMLQALPRDGKPVKQTNRDKAFSDIAKEIRSIAERLKQAPTR